MKSPLGACILCSLRPEISCLSNGFSSRSSSDTGGRESGVLRQSRHGLCVQVGRPMEGAVRCKLWAGAGQTTLCSPTPRAPSQATCMFAGKAPMTKRPFHAVSTFQAACRRLGERERERELEGFQMSGGEGTAGSGHLAPTPTSTL